MNVTPQSLHLIVMAGGSGTRFWPKSTAKLPKQLLSFGSETETLLEKTFQRFDDMVPARQRWVVTTESLATSVRTTIGEPVRILAEPQARNTAPCVYWAARAVADVDPEGIMLVMPADHLIPRQKEFMSTLEQAVEWAANHEDLVTLGVKPTRAETGYGYLHVGSTRGENVRAVQAFVEKPNAAKAQAFLSSGEYLWNGGMFVWRASVVLAAFDRYLPEMKKIWESTKGDIEKAYPQMPATSIDYGIMEKAQNVVTLSLDCGWDDLGSWTGLENLADLLGARQDLGIVSAGQAVAVDASGMVVDAPGKVVALLGVKDLIVVSAGEVILVADKSRAQDIKQMVEAVKAKRPDLV